MMYQAEKPNLPLQHGAATTTDYPEADNANRSFSLQLKVT
jgi:hypothetical protein